MTVRSAAYTVALDADVVCAGRAVSPPLGRPEKPDYGCACGDREVRRPRVAADVDDGAAREREETFERRAGRECRARSARLDHAPGQLALAGAVCDDGAQAEVKQKRVGERAVARRVPELRRPTAARIQNRVLLSNVSDDLVGLALVHARACE